MYSIILKYKKKVIRIYNLDNVLRIDHTKIPETFLDKEYSHENVLDGAIEGIRSLNFLCNVKRTWPMTISGYAKRIYQKTSGSRMLTNVIKGKIDDVPAEAWCSAADSAVRSHM